MPPEPQHLPPPPSDTTTDTLSQISQATQQQAQAGRFFSNLRKRLGGTQDATGTPMPQLPDKYPGSGPMPIDKSSGVTPHRNIGMLQ